MAAVHDVCKIKPECELHYILPKEKEKKMKHLTLRLVIGIIFILTVVPFAQASDNVITLKVADTFPIKHPMNKVVNIFMDEAKTLSNGRLDFQYFPAQQLGKLQDMLKVSQKGLADISYVGVPFFTGQLPLNSVALLPFWYTSTEGTAIYSRMVEGSTELQQEWANNHVRPILIATTSQYDIQTSDVPLNHVNDVKGLRLKSSGGVFENIAKRYGVLPISMPSNEAYEAVQRGIIDGTINSFPTVQGYRLQEVSKHYTVGLRLGGFVAAYVINEKTYNKLPADLQQVLVQAGQKAAEISSKTWDDLSAKIVENLEKSGANMYKITKENKEEWYAPLKGIEEDWIAENEKKGLPARKVFEQFKQIAEEVTSQK